METQADRYKDTHRQKQTHRHKTADKHIDRRAERHHTDDTMKELLVLGEIQVKQLTQGSGYSTRFYL